MDAAEVRESLRHRWPDSEYLTIREAPQDSMRQGRKLDLLVVSQWESRGHELDGVEIKVSMNDWRRELKEAAKADWWFRHVHRFWIAVPAEIADKVKADLPTGWGLLACNATGSVIKVKPDKHAAQPFSWNTTIGLLRAAADAGPTALAHARALGERLGQQKAEAEFTHRTADGQVQRQLEALRTEISAFEKTCGIELGELVRREQGRRLGEAVKLAMAWSDNPVAARRDVERAEESVVRALDALRASKGAFVALGVSV